MKATLRQERHFGLLLRKFEEDYSYTLHEDLPSKNYTYLVVFQDALTEFACENKINRSTLRVFMYLLGKMGYGNRINKSQVQISEALKMQQSQVSKAIKFLIEKGAIVHFIQERVFYLSPKIGWRGSIEEFDKFMKRKKFDRIRFNDYVNEEEEEMENRIKEKLREEKRARELDDLVI